MSIHPDGPSLLEEMRKQRDDAECKFSKAWELLNKVSEKSKECKAYEWYVLLPVQIKSEINAFISETEKHPV